jgi:hypothetical protein
VPVFSIERLCSTKTPVTLPPEEIFWITPFEKGRIFPAPGIRFFQQQEMGVSSFQDFLFFDNLFPSLIPFPCMIINRMGVHLFKMAFFYGKIGRGSWGSDGVQDADADCGIWR